MQLIDISSLTGQLLVHLLYRKAMKIYQYIQCGATAQEKAYLGQLFLMAQWLISVTWTYCVNVLSLYRIISLSESSEERVPARRPTWRQQIFPYKDTYKMKTVPESRRHRDWVRTHHESKRNVCWNTFTNSPPSLTMFWPERSYLWVLVVTRKCTHLT